MKEWSLNERVRRKVRKIASIVVSAGLRAAARFGLYIYIHTSGLGVSNGDGDCDHNGMGITLWNP